MSSKNVRNFFTQNGKTLKTACMQDLKMSLHFETASEQISTLFDKVIDVENEKKSAFEKAAGRLVLVCANIGNRIDALMTGTAVQLRSFFFNFFTPRTAVVWTASSAGIFSAVALFVLISPFRLNPTKDLKYNIYASRPLTIEQTSFDIYAKDSRSQKINVVFKAYKCPMEGLGEVFIHEADKNNIPWWLVAAVSFQESGCGKKSPKVDGEETYNAWGWGIYGDNMHTFDNWAQGIETVSKYFGNKFYSKGVTNTCDIMKVYTPPSNGSWCKGVDYFGDLIQNYRSPDNSTL